MHSLGYVLESCLEHGIKDVIYSSSCTVYGVPSELPVKETTPPGHITCPYGWTKYMGEQVCRDVTTAYPAMHIGILRYFNPAGAHPGGGIGEDPLYTAVNLVPVICDTAAGRRPALTVHGTDYDTRDGSCIRDYIHVMDLAEAHLKALQYLRNQCNMDACPVFNLGSGNGVTVLEAIHAFEKVTGQKLNYITGPRRTGDVPAIWADCTKAKNVLGWTPRYSIEDMMLHAWKWAKYRYTVE
jgi:UDP-glucose 4-epimerase